VVDDRQQGHAATKARQVTRGLDHGSHARVCVGFERIDQQLACALHGRALDGENCLLG
jgi:hypothetical protein